MIGRKRLKDAAGNPLPDRLWLSLSRGGGEQTYFAPLMSIFRPFRSSAVKVMYCGQVSACTGKERCRAQRTCSIASLPDTCTIKIGTPTISAWLIARCVASLSTTWGREVPKRSVASTFLREPDCIDVRH